MNFKEAYNKKFKILGKINLELHRLTIDLWLRKFKLREKICWLITEEMIFAIKKGWTQIIINQKSKISKKK